jgi:hypothetical protein
VLIMLRAIGNYNPRTHRSMRWGAAMTLFCPRCPPGLGGSIDNSELLQRLSDPRSTLPDSLTSLTSCRHPAGATVEHLS